MPGSEQVLRTSLLPLLPLQYGCCSHFCRQEIVVMTGTLNPVGYLAGSCCASAQGSRDKWGLCRELGANLPLLFQNKPHSDATSADGGQRQNLCAQGVVYSLVAMSSLKGNFEHKIWKTYCGQREPKTGVSFPCRCGSQTQV